MRTVYAPLAPIPLQDHPEITCVRCQEELDRHQPVDSQPDRLLGTCPGCDAWYLIDLVHNQMLLLPDATGPSPTVPYQSPERH